MLADLHIHSWYSDGTLSSKEIVSLAKKEGIGIISICDHNMVAAYEEMLPLCKENDIKLILGAEINSLYEEKEFHILAYDFDPKNQEMQTLFNYNQKIMYDMGHNLIDLAQSDYHEISIKEFSNYRRKKKDGGWESINYLIEQGLVKNFEDFLKFCSKYNLEGENKFKSIEEIANIIHNAGGKAIVAHAGDMVDNEPTKFKETIKNLLAQGVDGFECYYTSHTKEVSQMLVDFCKQNNLIITAGSDEHGGFNNIVNEIEYYIGVIKIDLKELNLEGIKFL